ncbi:MAG: response regulator [Myxococcota bacterium]
MLPRILIADDERLATMALQMFLTDEGYEVRTATSAEGTVSEGRSFRPDLLMVDYLLGPGDRGTDVARTLRTDLQNLKVLIMTGLPAEELGSNKDLQEYTVLYKPLDLELVARSVASLVGGGP